MFLYPNVTVSSLKMNSFMLQSALFVLPVLSISNSKFVFNQINISRSFSTFLYGQKYKSLVVENSRFFKFLSPVLKIDGSVLTECPATNAMFTINNVPDTLLVSCIFNTIQNGPAIHSNQNDLRMFSLNFSFCRNQNTAINNANGGAVSHTGGYLSSNGCDYFVCTAQNFGGAIYHSDGSLNLYRSSFNSVFATEHFCFYAQRVTITGQDFYINNCYFPNINGSSLFLVEPEITGQTILVHFSYCRFSFSQSELAGMIGNQYNLNYNNEFDLPEYNHTLMRKVDSFTFSPTNVFSPTDGFSPSQNFSASELFTASSAFSASSGFSQSYSFSESQIFSASDPFTQSNPFTQSFNFSASFAFTASAAFTLSNAFSASEHFSASESFTPTRSQTPTYSPVPTRSPGTPTTPFTFSNAFSDSNVFTASAVVPTATQSDIQPTGVLPSGTPVATAQPLSFSSVGIAMLVIGLLLVVIGLIANIILLIQMARSGEIIITQEL